MNSMPQHDVANGSGQMEFFRAIPTTLSRLVAKKPAPSYPSGFSTSFISVFLVSVDCISNYLVLPLQRFFLDNVEKAHQQQGNKDQHLQEAGHPELFEIHGPGIHEDHFHVKKNEQDRDQKITDGEWDAGISTRFDSTFKGFQLYLRLPLWSEPVCRYHRQPDEARGQREHQGDRSINH